MSQNDRLKIMASPGYSTLADTELHILEFSPIKSLFRTAETLTSV